MATYFTFAHSFHLPSRELASGFIVFFIYYSISNSTYKGKPEKIQREADKHITTPQYRQQAKMIKNMQSLNKIKVDLIALY